MLADRYELLDQLGRGGMGMVWRARDQVLGREVAVKEVALDPGFDEAEHELLKERTKREARSAARLSHPGIITVYDVIEQDGKPWIVMELIRSRSLQEIIDEDGPLPWRRAAGIGRLLVDALRTAHEAGVLHRDVKPSNVLITADGRSILTDFGIARAVGESTLTASGLVMGSPAYVAPERASGRPAEPASDLWSLGALLYASMAGRSPFQRSEPLASLVAVVTDEPAPLPAAGPLWPLLEGLLRKDPAARPSYDEAVALLDTAEAEAPPAPPPAAETVPEPAPTPVDVRAEAPDEPVGTTPAQVGRAQGRRVWLPVAALASLALTGGLVYALLSQDEDTITPTAASGTPSEPSASRQTPSADPKPTTEKPDPAPAPKAAPAGFTVHKASSGYSVALPKEWSGPERKSGGDFYYSPDRSRWVQIDQTARPKPSALKDWKDLEPDVRSRFPGYHRLRIAPVVKGAPIADATGKKSADWEYTWGSGDRLRHVLSRGVILNHRGYAIVLSAPHADWSSARSELAPVFETFEAKS